MKVVVGIDVGKRELDVSVSQGPVRSFANTAEGIAALLNWIASQDASEAVCEPTGGYEREVVRRLEESGLSVHVAHPNKVRNFARRGPGGEDRRAGRTCALPLWRGVQPGAQAAR